MSPTCICNNAQELSFRKACRSEYQLLAIVSMFFRAATPIDIARAFERVAHRICKRLESLVKMQSCTMRMLSLICSVFFVTTCAGLEQYVAFDAASASSTYSAGNLVGSPAFTAQQALSGGSGYWYHCPNNHPIV